MKKIMVLLLTVLALGTTAGARETDMSDGYYCEYCDTYFQCVDEHGELIRRFTTYDVNEKPMCQQCYLNALDDYGWESLSSNF